MAFLFPWSNLHELNLDWILSKVKTLVDNNEEFNTKADYAVSTADEAKTIAEQASQAQIADGAVTTIKIADGAVTTIKIADGDVTNAKIADNAVTGSKIAQATIQTGNLSTGCVTTPYILDGAVTASKLENSLTTPTEISDPITWNTTYVDASTTATLYSLGRLRFLYLRIQPNQYSAGSWTAIGSINTQSHAPIIQIQPLAGTTTPDTNPAQMVRIATSGNISLFGSQTGGTPYFAVVFYISRS